MPQIYLMIMIANRKSHCQYLDFFQTHHLPVTIRLTDSSAADSQVTDAFGKGDTDKSLYLTLITWDTWITLKEDFYENIGINLPEQGMAFLIPLRSIGGKKTRSYLTTGQEVSTKKERPWQDSEYEILVAISNAGYNKVVMDAAKSAGAKDGTVLMARESDTEQAQQFFGVPFTEERELTLLIAEKKKRNSIIRAIMEKAGTDTPAGGLVFSLPVTDTVGLMFCRE